MINAGANVGANGYVSLSNNVTVSGNVVIGNANPTLIPSSCCSGPGCGPPTSGNVTGSIITGAPYVRAPAIPTFPGSGQTGTAFPGTSPSYNSTTASVPQTSSSDLASPVGTITPGSNSFAWPCISGVTCNGSATNPYLINSISLSGNGQNVRLYGGPGISQPVYYDLDTLSLAGNNGSITVTGYVVLNVRTSLDVEGEGLVNSLNVPPEALQINYAGTSSASVGGNGGVSAIITAPLASVSLHGGGSSGFMTGAIRALNVAVQGGFPIHYDVELDRLDGVLGQMVRSSYTRIKQ